MNMMQMNPGTARLVALYRKTTAKSFRSAPSLCSSTAEPVSSEYVHPLSQVVLEHLQDTRHTWIVENGLDRGLRLQRDGTFEIKFPSEAGRIWTSYDSNEKKHWLAVQRNDLVGRYLLQDNLKPAWHSDSRSTQEKICDAVDSMIEKIDQEEESSSS